ncbi:hypothetical protein LBMAG21_11510 [Armatimonadota bacterium]|nr:hypothetical protein LBMAG21_11510 [Armatimonadota bacterium]
MLSLSTHGIIGLSLRLGSVFLLAGGLLLSPLEGTALLEWQNTMVAAVVVFGMGKALFDTFYEERFR